MQHSWKAQRWNAQSRKAQGRNAQETGWERWILLTGLPTGSPTRGQNTLQQTRTLRQTWQQALRQAWQHLFPATLQPMVWAIATMIAISAIALPQPAIALGGPQPELNAPAPTFSLPTNTGDGNIALEDYRGQWLVVYFYPKDFTPGCTLEARRFQQDAAEYQQRNTQVLGISVDSVDSHAEFCDSEGLRFPLLSDEDGSVSRAYGSYLTGMSLRHTYLVDPEGILRERFLGVLPAIHSAEVLARLDELQATAGAVEAMEETRLPAG